MTGGRDDGATTIGIGVADRVERIFLRELHVAIEDRDRDLIESGLLDSLALVRLLAILEREFALTIDLDGLELDDFRSVSSIAVFVGRRAPPRSVPRAAGG